MPRDLAGNYTLPNPDVVSDTVIDPDWANTTLHDIADTLSSTLDRAGAGGMLGPLRLLLGSAATPSLSFSADTDTGLYGTGAGGVAVSSNGSFIASFEPGTWQLQTSSGSPLDTVFVQSSGLQALNVHSTQWVGDLFNVPARGVLQVTNDATYSAASRALTSSLYGLTLDTTATTNPNMPLATLSLHMMGGISDPYGIDLTVPGFGKGYRIANVHDGARRLEHGRTYYTHPFYGNVLVDALVLHNAGGGQVVVGEADVSIVPKSATITSGTLRALRLGYNKQANFAVIDAAASRFGYAGWNGDNAAEASFTDTRKYGVGFSTGEFFNDDTDPLLTIGPVRGGVWRGTYPVNYMDATLATLAGAAAAFTVFGAHQTVLPNSTVWQGVHKESGPNGASYVRYTYSSAHGGTPVSAGGVAVASSGAGVSFVTSSDARLKAVVGSLEDGLAIIDSIAVKEFYFKTDPDKVVQAGFLAQQLQHTALAGRIATDPATGYHSVDYTTPVPYLVRAVQQLHAMLKVMQ